MKTTANDLEQVLLDKIRALPFVRSVQLEKSGERSSVDGILTIGTDVKKLTFRLEVKKSFLGRADLDSIIAIQKTDTRRLFLFALYVPLPAAEKLIAAGIQFIDLRGNMHIDLLPNHLITQTGRTNDPQSARKTSFTRATIQFLFSVAHSPRSMNSPVRELAQLAGVSVGTVSSARKFLLERGLFVTGKSGEVLVGDPKELRDTLVRGYLDLLRRKILIGRYRTPYRTAGELFEKRKKSRWDGRLALTGPAAAYSLQRIYRTSEICLFAEESNLAVQKICRLIPAQDGQVVLLRAFGDAVFWQEVDGMLLATPWLIYAEMYASPDPRSHEAAEELRARYIG